jgi:hypothetical protein
MINETCFSDERITVRLVSLDPAGVLKLQFEEKQRSIGLYKITVLFASGNEFQIEYNGANPARSDHALSQTHYRNDAVQSITAVRARD